METTYLKKFEDELNVCIRCAYCFEGCPMFKELGWEADTARGKSLLAYGLLTGEIKPSQYIADKIYECTYCKDCIERCSAKVPIPDIMTAARADLLKAGYSYDSHRDLINRIKETGNIFGKDIKAPLQEGETPVLLGCRFLERTDDALRYLEILQKLGLKPRVVDEICCGMPLGVLGYKDEFLDYKEEFKKRISSNEFICMCTTCVFFIKNAYPELKTTYIMEVIRKRLPDYQFKKLDKKITYHDPCNLARGLDMVEEPRGVLREIGAELVEMKTTRKQAECCGGGGGVLVTDKLLSEKLARNRFEQAMETGAETLTTLCPTCELNFVNIAKEKGNSMQVKNVLDLVWEALR